MNFPAAFRSVFPNVLEDLIVNCHDLVGLARTAVIAFDHRKGCFAAKSDVSSLSRGLL